MEHDVEMMKNIGGNSIVCMCVDFFDSFLLLKQMHPGLVTFLKFFVYVEWEISRL